MYRTHSNCALTLTVFYRENDLSISPVTNEARWTARQLRQHQYGFTNGLHTVFEQFDEQPHTDRSELTP